MAMQAEFDAAVEDGKPFVFAIGCLFAAWREMAKQDDGRLTLVNYALSVGLLIPMAALQFHQAVRVLISLEHGPSRDMLDAGIGQNPYLTWSQNSAMPVLLVMWLLPAVAHLGLAWVLVERDWPRVVKFGAIIGAAMMTLWLFTAVLMLDLSPLGAQMTRLIVELAGVLGIARWHARIVSNASPEQLAR
ncbi:hypothetical protein ACFSGX_05965 [Sphingomonas arantia]|uniref:Yip1 domain-containing protein n=2 Tax=Sphingomonas arantia TaxID=1460676 RepID=A0ABW4TUT2_9SPHN